MEICILLPDLLKKTDKSRIIFVVSTAYKSAAAVVDPSNPNPTNSPSEKNFNFKMYSKSKFSSVLFTKELARRLDGTGKLAFLLFFRQLLVYKKCIA